MEELMRTFAGRSLLATGGVVSFLAGIHANTALLRSAVLVLAAAPLVYYLLACLVALLFFRRQRAGADASFMPPLSILKPVYGVDFASFENFCSFCRQDYPDYEILFAVNDDSDPAVPVIRSVISQFPERKVRILSGAPRLGGNQKVNNLAFLAREALHDILVLTDGDVRVGPRYLREVVAPLADKQVAAVTSLYRAVAEPNFWAELEAIGAAGDFFPSVLMAAATEGIRFTLGASVATSKRWLGRIGGFESFADYLADDFELGNRLSRSGGRVVLSREAVRTMYPAQTWRGFWQHQLRWARTIRLCRPLSYVGLLLTQGLPWAILAALLAASAAFAAAYFGAYLLLRTAMAWIVGVWGINDSVLQRRIWLLPLRDALHFAVWVAGFFSRRVVWSGTQYKIQHGRMIPIR